MYRALSDTRAPFRVKRAIGSPHTMVIVHVVVAAAVVSRSRSRGSINLGGKLELVGGQTRQETSLDVRIREIANGLLKFN